MSNIQTLPMRLAAEPPNLSSRTLSGQAIEAQSTGDRAKILKSAKDFESILLGEWLQSAEKSFASVPGGPSDNQDAGSEQMQNLAMQSLAASLTASGGIGLAKMVAQGLSVAHHRAKQNPESKQL